MSTEVETTFAVGDGATVHLWTDAHAYTVVAVSKSGRSMTMRRDKATRTNREKDTFSPGGFFGHTECPDGQKYEYERDPNGAVCRAYLNKRGVWLTRNSKMRVTVGRHEFYDRNF